MKKILFILMLLSMTLAACGLGQTSPEEAGKIIAEATAQAGATATAEAAEAPAANSETYASGLITLVGFPESAEAVRWGDGVLQSNECGYAPICWLLADPGVLSYDHANGKDELNPSAVWSGGANVDNVLENLTGSWLLPGNGYMKVTFGQGDIELADYGLFFEAQDGVNYTFVVRGVFAEEGGTQTKVDFTVEEDFKGSLKVMRYPISDPTKAGFFSWVHLDEDVLNGHSNDNCDYDGCQTTYIVGMDVNRGTVTIIGHEMGRGYWLVYSNTDQP